MASITSGRGQTLRLALALTACVACSEAELQPVDNSSVEVVDDRLDISGEVCTSPPTEQVFPVKIMFIVDTSGSMQFTDPSAATASGCLTVCSQNGIPNCDGICAGAQNPGRQAAVQKVVDRFRNNPAVSFSLIRFNGRITINGSADGDGTGFTNDAAVLNAGLTSLAQADITTDYQGALSSAFQVLERDMLESDPVQRARTKYVLIFLTDGAPNPVCQKGCGNDEVDIGVIVDSWCDVPRDQWCDNFNADDDLCQQMQQWYPAMLEPCKEYNTRTDLIKKVNEITALGERYGVGDIRFNTGFLFVDNLPPLVQQLLAVDKDTAESLLKAMAEAGRGLHRSFNAGQAIDFLDINYSSVARPFDMTSFMVTNVNALPAINKLLVDSDGDGLDDETEFELNTDPKNTDSDGDGYNDRLEAERLSAGFDPADNRRPVRICPQNERVDRDGDGLLDCEEAMLGTDPKVADSDRDRVPDGVEFWFGTNPLKADVNEDSDVDQLRDGEEIRAHSDPKVADPEIQADFRYVYDIEEQGERVDRRTCRSFDVRRVRLVTTAQRNRAGTVGYNDIFVFFGEGPVDDERDFGSFKAACIRAQYVDRTCESGGEQTSCGFKNPADGKVSLTPDDFYPLSELMQRRAAAGGDPESDPCVGVPAP